MPQESDSDPWALTVMIARRVLEEQAATLAVVRSRLDRARALAPSGAESEWAGPARRLYDSGLDELHRALASAEASVDAALADTCQAIETLASHVG
ncbi:hypothetical protein ABIB15_002555 [Marisediminicola sp. UYEF4]|uniref:hypothetical protein n=1 Tax=Marisediminicola sp. UYEF4 TaxID=1756384 RepID=UPI00339A0021